MLSPLLVLNKLTPFCNTPCLEILFPLASDSSIDSFIALPGKEGHSGLLSLKAMHPNSGDFGEEFYGNGSRRGLLIRLEGVQGCR